MSLEYIIALLNYMLLGVNQNKKKINKLRKPKKKNVFKRIT